MHSHHMPFRYIGGTFGNLHDVHPSRYVTSGLVVVLETLAIRPQHRAGMQWFVSVCMRRNPLLQAFLLWARYIHGP